MEKDIFKSRIILLFLGLSVLLLITSFILILINVGDLSYPLILHFNSYEGVNLTGEASSLWSILIVAVLVVVLNFFIGNSLFKRERMMAYLIFAINVIISIVTLISVAQIISIN
ncbi:MAG: hypothetical protein WD471_01475 [Candidatus Paceibacterota bacterium]